MAGDNARAAASLDVGSRDPANHKREYEVAAAIAVRAKDTIEADLAGGAEGGGGVTVRQGSYHGEGVPLGRDDGASLEHAAQPFDAGNRPIREVAQRALTHLAPLTVALAQQNGGR